jgi:acetoin utilization protein AcuB
MTRAERKRLLLRGFFTGTDEHGLIPRMFVRAVMTPLPFTVSTDCSVQQLVVFFHEKQFRHFLVTNGSRLAGVISDRDVIPYSGNPLGTLDGAKTVTAADLMSTDLVTVTPTTLLADAIEKMVNAGINSLPVVDGDETVGILTGTDIFLALEQLLRCAKQ